MFSSTINQVYKTTAVADTSGADTRSKQELRDPGRSGLRVGSV